MKTLNFLAMACVPILMGGCMSRTAPTDGDAKSAPARNISISAPVVPNPSPVVSLKCAEFHEDHKVHSRTLSAKNANFLNLTTQKVGSPYKEADYIIEKQEYVLSPTTAIVSVSITNVSNRAFDLSGIVIRVAGANGQVQASSPSDITSGKRLAPGELATFSIDITGLDHAKNNDTVRVSMFELPAEISDAGAIAKRCGAEFDLVIKIQETEVEVRRYFVQEHRRFSEDVPPDLANHLR